MFELIYTSYPRGLESGRSGFTSVAYTEGIPRHYIQLCESLSSYPFIYPLGNPMYDLNPEIYSHYRFKINGDYGSKVSGEEISILSRIAVSGRDYTGRENKIAHHIILDANEQLSCSRGPAWEMMYGNLFIDHWNQEPCLLPKKRVKSSCIEGSEPLLSNQKEQADILAQSAQYGERLTSFILFDPVLHRGLCLPLVAKALNMIMPEKRWAITFNTYFVSKNIDSDCVWRFCPVDLESAQTRSLDYIERYPDALVIDLCQKTIQGKIPFNQLGQSSANSFELHSCSLPPSGLYLPGTEDSSHTEGDQLQEREDQQMSYLSGSKKRPLWLLACVIIALSFMSALFSDHNPWLKPDIKNNEATIIEKKTALKKEMLHELVLTTKSTLFESSIDADDKKADDEKIELSFYGEPQQIHADNDDLKSMKCRIIKNDGMEIDINIERPITNDTLDWAIMAKGYEQPLGNISSDNLSLYYKESYSAIYLDIPTRRERNLIWVGPLKITPSMISKGIEPDTLEIRFAPAMSDLLPSFLSLLSSEALTSVVELKQNYEITKESNSNLNQSSLNQSGDTLRDKEGLKNKEGEIIQDQSLIQTKTLFYPLCTLKNSINKKDQILTSIHLKFTSDEFEAILQKSFSDNKETQMRRENPDIKKEISDKEMLYQFKPENLFNELSVYYKDNHNNRTHTIFCFTCEK